MSTPTLTAQRTERFSTITISPPEPIDKVRGVARSVQFTGSEGSEWIPPEVHGSEQATTISFESRVFGLRNDEDFEKYYLEIARNLSIGIVTVVEAQPDL